MYSTCIRICSSSISLAVLVAPIVSSYGSPCLFRYYMIHRCSSVLLTATCMDTYMCTCVETPFQRSNIYTSVVLICYKRVFRSCTSYIGNLSQTLKLVARLLTPENAYPFLAGKVLIFHFRDFKDGIFSYSEQIGIFTIFQCSPTS